MRLLTVDKRKHGLVLQVSDQKSAFGSMLTWENALGNDLEGLVVESALSSSSVFIDRTIYEIDVRILMDNGQEKAAYGFVNPDILVIAPDSETFTRVIVEQF